jgi:antitoxin component YwqK of YwqJK toxin-antitoxin module
MAQCS